MVYKILAVWTLTPIAIKKPSYWRYPTLNTCILHHIFTQQYICNCMPYRTASVCVDLDTAFNKPSKWLCGVVASGWPIKPWEIVCIKETKPLIVSNSQHSVFYPTIHSQLYAAVFVWTWTPHTINLQNDNVHLTTMWSGS